MKFRSTLGTRTLASQEKRITLSTTIMNAQTLYFQATDRCTSSDEQRELIKALTEYDLRFNLIVRVASNSNEPKAHRVRVPCIGGAIEKHFSDAEIRHWASVPSVHDIGTFLRRTPTPGSKIMFLAEKETLGTLLESIASLDSRIQGDRKEKIINWFLRFGGVLECRFYETMTSFLDSGATSIVSSFTSIYTLSGKFNL